MSTAPQPLLAARFPLWGARLIEASAGTGKTWTIAALYLRLIIGHGGEHAFVRPLMPAQILVMTFTRAATHELSGRIRERLLQAAQAFRQPDGVDDPLLLELLQDCADPSAREQAAWRLAMAAESMDDAAVLTIDAWCQRMLREHAFDSGSLWNEELVPNETAVLTEAVQDYWRHHVYELPASAVLALHAIWRGVEPSVRDIRGLLGKVDSSAQAQPPLAQLLQQWLAPLQPLLAQRQQQVQAMASWLQLQLTEHRVEWSGSTFKDATVNKWLTVLRRWADSDWPLQPPAIDKGLERLTPRGLREARKKAAPDLGLLPECFAWFETLVNAYQQHPDGPARSRVRLHAAAWVHTRLQTLKRRRGHIGFADLQARLHAALHGPQAERLRSAIVQQFPVAMIDEFQDTSPEQYAIFEAIYRPHSEGTSHQQALLLIGDPKQSIYGFRGADIYSYLRAKTATAGRHYALSVNRRSTHALVQAVNHSFERADTRSGAGAFGFRTADTDALPFLPVQSHGRAEQWVSTEHTPVPPLQLVHQLTPQNKAGALRDMANACAERIAQWLNDSGNGFEQDGRFQRLRPRDVAVLVRNVQEATAIRRALHARALVSVYLSDKDSVFASDEARDLVHWLQAVASPQDVGLARAALALDSLALPWAELLRLAQDDDALDEHLQRLQALQRSWRQLGVLAMLRQTLTVFDLPARWLAQPNGERRLTNVLHLAELLQHASAEVEGEQALIRWLMQQRESAVDNAEEQVLRLESDEDLISVVTVHKSKGLQYPVVCLPFATTWRSGDRADAVLLPAADGTRSLMLDPDDDALDRNDAERLREDLRLLYVAMTRACHGLWMGFPLIREGNKKSADTHRSAAGYLLGGNMPMEPAGWLHALQQWAAGCAHIDISAAPEHPDCTRWAGRDTAPPAMVDTPDYVARFDRRWAIASYSRLTRDLHGAPPVALPLPDLSPLSRPQPADDEAQTDTPGTDEPVSAPIWHRFKRGPITGNFLHDQLEWLAREGFDMPPAVADRLAQRLRHSPHAEQADELQAWLRDVAHTLLAAVGAPLAELRTLQPELEFWLPLQGLDTAAVDALCRQYWLPGVERPALQRSQLHGMLMGFADLVFEHQGRYWVLDHKSNHLGHHDAAYSAAGLASAMAKHRYDVQAAIYLLALHRLLRSRLGNAYQPDQHLGGAVYLFLRGVHGPEQGCCVLGAPTAMLDALDAMIDTPAQPSTHTGP